MNETVWNPLILSANCEPSPAEAFRPFVVQVLIVDIFGGEQVEVHCSGEFYSGEV